MTPPEGAICWEDDCTQPAIAKKPHGMTADGTPTSVWVCYDHAQEQP